jgi:hypothetical protein
MKANYRVTLIAVAILCGSLAARAQTSAPPEEPKSLADVARELRDKRQAESQTSTVAAARAEQKELQYRQTVQSLFARGAYGEIDAEADAAGMSKERFAGGVWKLYALYESLTMPAGGNRASDEAWTAHLQKLEAWVKARPQSITARVALAEGYRSLGWKARGGGESDTVTQSGWRQLEEGNAKALITLVGAAKLNAKCPHWYLVMLAIARDQSWDKAKTRELFEAAAAFEPDYHYNYREYANNLLPKWNGEPGDAEAFAEESYKRLGGGAKGAFMYFEIATVLYCVCADDRVQPTLDWDRIKTGFAEMDRQYGATTVKLNRFAALAYLYRDREATRRSMLRVGDQWDSGVWRTIDVFDKARLLAGLPSL